MRYMMFVGVDPEGEQLEEDDVEAWVADVDGRGKRVIGDRLRPVDDATTVRVRNGELLVTDGPFTESKDWIVGFDILDCADLDEAIEIASAHPMARAGRLELRPFWPIGD
ncbi:MAG TPA: YciI family protein [Euzebyales bacterium]|nr:YciI family protein [Euzebyales bacterium]